MGAIPGTGRPLKKNAVTRVRPAANVRILPAEPRPGPAPNWPAPGGKLMNAYTTKLWERVWNTPMGWAWEELGFHDDVARYVLARQWYDHMDPENEPTSKLSLAVKQVQDLEDRLGLNHMGLIRNRWQIDRDGTLPDGRDKELVAKVTPIKKRVRAVDAVPTK